MRASGTGQPTIVPACDERNRELRPVTGWRRTRGWRTGLKSFALLARQIREAESPRE